MNQSVQERASRDDQGLTSKLSTVFEGQSDDAPSLCQDGAGTAQNPGYVGMGLHGTFKPLRVKVFISLSARGPDRWSTAPVEKLELNPGRVNTAAHQPAERIDLPDEVTLRRAADCRIARHVGDGLCRKGAQANFAAGLCGCPRCLNAGVARANDDNIELLHG